MVDKTIKVSVLEGDLAQLSALGFPLPLCIQLQLSCLKIDEAMWTAKSTPGGFSVNLFWPAPAPEKNGAQLKKRRKRKRRRAKARSQVTISSPNPILSSDLPATTSDDIKQPKTIQSPESCIQQKPNEEQVVDLAVCSNINYEVREGIHGVSYHCEDEDDEKWTPVVAKKRKRKYAPVPNFIRRRFPPDHPIRQQNGSADSDTDSGSECDLCSVIPSNSTNVQYSEVDGTPGLSIWTSRTRSWTPIAARTRARLKQ